MPQLGFTIDKQAYSFEEALDYAATGTAPVPVEFLRALIGDQRESDVPSPSTLGTCLRRFMLERRTGYHPPLDSGLPALFGTALHQHLERFAPPTALTEVRLEATLDLGLEEPYATVQLRGTADYVDPEYDQGAGVLRDWKTKVYLPAEWYPTEGHLVQVNIYHWLWTKQGHKPLRDWEIFYVSQSGFKYYRGPLEDPARVERWLRKKFREWARHHRDGTLPPPVPEFHQRDKRNKLVAPCSYCPVRAACAAKYEEESRHDDGNQATTTADAGPAVPLDGGPAGGG